MLSRVVRSVAGFAWRERLFRRTPRVLLGVSGGPDSVACLLVLLKLRQQFGFEVVPAHFDHQLREGSAEEQRRVRELCSSLGLECVTGEGDARHAAAESHTGLEDAARRLRYQFLAFVAGKEQAACIATGHTRDDQVETILMRLQRGTGVRGLRGMLPAGPVPGASAMRLVRPFLETSRADTLAICAETGLLPLSDPSNADARFARNRVRLETLPLLREANPAFETSLLGLAASAREAFAVIERQALAVQPSERGRDGSIFPLGTLRDLPGEALILLVEREAAFHNLEPAVNRTRVENLRQVMAKGSGAVDFGAVQVEVSSGVVRVGARANEPLSFPPVLLNVPGVTLAGGSRVQVSTEPIAAAAGDWFGSLDASLARGALRLRPPAPGDRIRTDTGLRSLQDRLVNLKVPRWQRRRLIALADAGTVLLLVNGPAAQTPQSDSALFVKASELPPR